MKIKNLFLIGSIIYLSPIKAQESAKEKQIEKSKPSGYLSINAGISSPIGDFSNEFIGGASSGTNFTFNMSTPIKKSHFGICTNISYGSLAMSDVPFGSELSYTLLEANIPKEDFYISPNTNFNSYTNLTSLVGLYITLPIKKRVCIDTRLLGGFNFINRPSDALDFIYYPANFKGSYYQEASSSTSFAFNIGESLRLNLGKKQKICLIINYDLLISNATFEFKEFSLFRESGSAYLIEEEKKITKSYSVSTSNVTFGIGYVFGKK